LTIHATELYAQREGWEKLPANKRSTVLAASIEIAGAHELFGFTVNNTNASAQYVLVFDLATLPADGAVPDVSFTAVAAADKGVVWLPARRMNQGVVIANSSTAASLTLGSADCFFDVQYL
jgi:hypothetical protein